MNKAQFVIALVILCLFGVAGLATQVNPDTVRFALRLPVVRGAIAGAVVALKVDYEAFKSFQSIDDAAAYRWSTALLHAAQGAINGIGVGSLLAGVTS